MKITAIEIKPGMIIEHKNDYWNVSLKELISSSAPGALSSPKYRVPSKSNANNFIFSEISNIFSTFVFNNHV